MGVAGRASIIVVDHHLRRTAGHGVADRLEVITLDHLPNGVKLSFMLKYVFWSAFAVLIFASNWWGFGALPKRNAQVVPSGHWLASYLSPAGQVDVMAAQRDGHAAVAAEGNAIALLLRAWGPQAVCPPADPALQHTLGVDPDFAACLALPDEGPTEPVDFARIIADANAGRLKSTTPQPTCASELAQAAEIPWTSGALPLAERWLEQHRMTLDQLMTERPTHAALPLVEGQPPSRQPVVQSLRTQALGRACAALARQRLAAGDHPGCVAAAAWITRLGIIILRDSARPSVGLSGCALIAQGCDVMQAVMLDPAVSAVAAQQWLAATADLPWPDNRLAVWMDRRERLMALEVADAALALPAAGVAESSVVYRQITDAYDALYRSALLPDSNERSQAGGEAYRKHIEEKLQQKSSLGQLIFAGPWARRELGTQAVTCIVLTTTFPSLKVIDQTLEKSRLQFESTNDLTRQRSAPAL